MRAISAAFAVTTALFLLYQPASAEMQRYGSFHFYDGLPNVLFLVGDIEANDSFELRRAMRDHDIDLVVTGSAGGNLYEGLQLASILNDKGIGTYVPEDANCESSCANIFFGGQQRMVIGNLGVHQFYDRSKSATSRVQKDLTIASTQYTTAEIIGIMNEFDTPAFVYEKMLGTDDIYYFRETEKPRLNRGADDPDFLTILSAVDSFIDAQPAVLSRPLPPVSTPADQVAAAPPAPAATPQTSIARYEGLDFFGMDLNTRGIRDISLQECESICESSSSCAAYSYVAKTRWCWPKSGVENISVARGTTSGVKDFSRVNPSLFDRAFVEVTGADIPGYDIYPRGLQNMTLDQCRMACENDGSCVAYSWVAPKNWCFPKYGVGQMKDFVGRISGIRN